MADATGGTVKIVDATMLDDQMQKLLNESYFATQVELTLIAQNSLFWDEENLSTGCGSKPLETNKSTESSEPEKWKSRLEKSIGNIKLNTAFTFKFGISPAFKSHENATVPFQVSYGFVCISSCESV